MELEVMLADDEDESEGVCEVERLKKMLGW